MIPVLGLHSRQKRSGIVKFGWLSLWPRIQLRGIHQNLPIGREFHMRTIHGTRRRAFEINPLAVVPTAVARTFEFIFAGFPIRSAAQVCAARVDHEDSIRRAVNPDAIFLLKLGVDTQREFRGVAVLENRVWFEQSARQEETKEGD